MKYTAYYYDNEQEHKVEVSVRRHAKLLTIFRKIGKAVAYDMFEKRIAKGQVEIMYDLPNVWTNGCLGWLSVGHHNVTIVEESGATLAA